MAHSVVFIDSELDPTSHAVRDLGAVRTDRSEFHDPSVRKFLAFIRGQDFICGHNILHFDLPYLTPLFDRPLTSPVIDTLYLSPLLFPERPYHKLLKDDKLQSDQLNNPLNDSKKAARLFFDEVQAFQRLPGEIQQIYTSLLFDRPEFHGFFAYLYVRPFHSRLSETILHAFSGQICEHADLPSLIRQFPMELAYALALIRTGDFHSITPPWLSHQFPKIEWVLDCLCNRPCSALCPYCQKSLNVRTNLKYFFGYDSFRTYNGEPLQEQAAQAAVAGQSLLAVFPTGGGKSVTFQLPALMAGRNVHGLTVVISPLQSLMKDQVDNLNARGIEDVVTVNGMLDPIERADAIQRVADGSASLLYISPEQLRSRTMEKILLSRNIVRFVIDEAHCFSAWGQDFRVDYLYIGDFIRRLQSKKQRKNPIPVSCFTATAKQKVISDICEYFKQKLNTDLALYTTTAARTNLHYTVLWEEADEEKYNSLRTLLDAHPGPAIIYASRVRRTVRLAEKLSGDGYPALPYHGQMDPQRKIHNQEAFMKNEVRIIVATSAFGMGVDKKDVELVIHYDISDSLENYVQEAGRAGRDPDIQAHCYILFNTNDLDKHFLLLNQTKISMNEIQQIWQAMKALTKDRATVCCSALEIARAAGWNDEVHDIETRVRTAIAALENAGYVRRGQNVPHVYATSIRVPDMATASEVIEKSSLIPPNQKIHAKRIIKSLISSRSIATASDGDAESRVDYLADTLGLDKSTVVSLITLMRQDKLLEDARDMSAYLYRSESQNKSSLILERFAKLEAFILSRMEQGEQDFALKELNEAAHEAGIAFSSVKNIHTVLFFLTIKGFIQKSENGISQHVSVIPQYDPAVIQERQKQRIDICRFIVRELYGMLREESPDGDEAEVDFSVVGLYNTYMAGRDLRMFEKPMSLSDVEDALLYLSKIGSLRLEGGFLVLYNGMEVKRLILDNRIRYKHDDYRMLSDFYKQKVEQIHIVGEYANLMIHDSDTALQFVQDYFQMDFRKFVSAYFKGSRAKEIERNITPEKYDQLFGGLSDVQADIIHDDESRCITVAAGPGSGKTRVLVHKLASLLLLEDVKHEQLLMLTFSRAAATEFKKRLMKLIGNAANFVEIKTFHSYCFDLLGKIGSLDGVENVVRDAADMIRNGGVEPGRIARTVLVIDEAQDMDENESQLIRALMDANEDMRVIAVGDDDQNIYEFRGSDSRHMRSLVDDYGAKLYEMTENFRSCPAIVTFANAFAASIHHRMKRQPIISMRHEPGSVAITRHTSPHMEEPLVRQLMQTCHDGTACVLTGTNDEALRVLGVLQKNGVEARLIQSSDGFCLYNLVEIRFFLKTIDRCLRSPVIDDALWDEAKDQLQTVYGDSHCLPLCLNLLQDFEETNSYSKYRTDLEEFMRESKPEDAFHDDRHPDDRHLDGDRHPDGERHRRRVFVSTIHKSKGHEFDQVYMLLRHTRADTDEEKRRLYVGMTRARDHLYIHTDTSLFDTFGTKETGGITYTQDPADYPEPEKITLHLSHRDVVLDFFKSIREKIFSLHSGRKLARDGRYLVCSLHGRTTRVVLFSKAFLQRLEHLESRGYTVWDAEVRFVVAWKGEEDERETPIILPSVTFAKSPETPTADGT